MPKPLSPCAEPGCPKVAVRNGRCENHQHKRPRGLRGPRSADNRPSAASRGYDARWRKRRERYLVRYPQCSECGATATMVHHIVPIAEGGTHAWSNLQPLCRRCHERLHARTG